MHHQTVVTPREHDLTDLNVFERAAFNLNYIARPKGGEHALAMDFAANELTHLRTNVALQNICHQS
jgi:hypothetical protein